MKTCTYCLQSLPLAQFDRVNRATGQRPARGGMGVAAICKRCRALKRSPETVLRREHVQALLKNGQKQCNVCHTVKAIESFAVRRMSVDGRCATCRECANQRSKQWRADHPGAFREWHQENQEHRRNYWDRWYASNAERRKGAYKVWAKANPEKVNANVANRIAQKNRAMPRWADRGRIAEVYEQALALTRQTGIRHDVDHIVPLRSRIVCGLHWEGNLQVLTKEANRKKSNRLVA